MSEGVRTLYVGHDGEKVVDSSTTLKQIEEIEKLDCGLQEGGRPLMWTCLNNPAETRTLFQYILRDRKRRVDQHILMADRPPFAVVTAVGNKAIRLEFYEGHDALKCTYDLRASELQGKELPKWLEQDPQAYNPFKFLRAIGFPVPEEIIEAVDKEQQET